MSSADSLAGSSVHSSSGDDGSSNHGGSGSNDHSPNPSNLYHRFDDVNESNKRQLSPAHSSRYVSVPAKGSPRVAAATDGSIAAGRPFGRSLSSGNAALIASSHAIIDDNDDTPTGAAYPSVIVSNNGAPAAKRNNYDTRTLPGVGIIHGNAAAAGAGNGGQRGQSRTVAIPRSATTAPTNQGPVSVTSLRGVIPPSGNGQKSNAGSRQRSRAGSVTNNMNDSYTDYREETIVATANGHYHNRTVSAITTIASRIMFTGWYTAVYLLMCLLCLFLLVWKLVNHLCLGDLPCLDEDEESDIYAALDIATTAMLLFEVSIRILATRKTFFKSCFNLFDFVVLLASIASFVVYVSGIRFGDSVTKSIILFVRYSIQLCRLILVFKRHRDRIRIMALATHAAVDFNAVPDDGVDPSILPYNGEGAQDLTDDTNGMTHGGYIGTGSPITAALLAQARGTPPSPGSSSHAAHGGISSLYGRPNQRVASDDDDDIDIEAANDMPDPPPKSKARA